MAGSPTGLATSPTYSTPCLASPVRVPNSFSGIYALMSSRYAGLSLLGHPGLVDLDPVYCMPATLIESMGLKKAWKALPRRQA